jgi:hypothetical protein
MSKYPMDKNSIKNLLYGGISELVNDREFYHLSSIGMEYSKLTDRGAAAILLFINQMAVNILVAQQAELDERAKKLVINGLKGEK